MLEAPVLVGLVLVLLVLVALVLAVLVWLVLVVTPSVGRAGVVSIGLDGVYDRAPHGQRAGRDFCPRGPCRRRTSAGGRRAAG